MRNKLWLQSLLALMMTLLLAVACIQKTARPFTKIIFLSNRDAEKREFDIFMMAPDGSNQQNLTATLNTIRTHSRPKLSPDQKKIAFVSFETQGPALKLMNLQDSSVIHLAWLTTDQPEAEFSPDGEKIVFVQRIEGRRQLNMVNVDGSQEINLSDNAFDEYDPCFSSDGSNIVFVSRREGHSVIYILNPANGNVREAFRDPGIAYHPVFSPDNSSIAFSLQREGISDIFVMKKNGTDVKNLTNNRAFDKSPVFSPDGNKIIFVSNQRGMKYQDICVIDKDGKQFRNLTPELNFINQHPSITPDGQMIIFDSVKFNDSEIYKVDIESGELFNLSQHPKWDQAPDI
ncbi:hypothetical protein GF406_08320 [candidate division KSB1 bacterium]|nr:hypothetical protein [candidate division KSB1 bacterium]